VLLVKDLVAALQTNDAIVAAVLALEATLTGATCIISHREPAKQLRQLCGKLEDWHMLTCQAGRFWWEQDCRMVCETAWG